MDRRISLYDESPRGPVLPRRVVVAAIGATSALTTFGIFAGESAASAATFVQYRHPFTSADLSDGWAVPPGPRNGSGRYHYGLDYQPPGGTLIPAVADGIVVRVVWNPVLGNCTVIQHPDGYYSGYCHLQQGSTLVTEGQTVSRSQSIGRVGNTGSASQGAHLHLTISTTIDGYSQGNTIDPWSFINARLTPGPIVGEDFLTEAQYQDLQNRLWTIEKAVKRQSTSDVLIYQATSSYNVIQSGWYYVQGADGTLRALRNTEVAGWLYPQSLETNQELRRAVLNWAGQDIYTLLTMYGLYEFEGALSAGEPGKLTGRLIVGDGAAGRIYRKVQIGT